MNMSDVKGTSNWTSHCGADFGFVDAYLREKQVLPSIRRSTRAMLNQEVLKSYDYIQEVYANNSAVMLKNEQDGVTRHNNFVFELYNINPKDGVPAYIEKELQQPVTDLSDTNKKLLEEQRCFYLSELYDAVRQDGLDSYLSEDVIGVLNSDKFSFQAYSEAKMLEEAHEIEKEDARKSKLISTPNRDYSTGFEMDDSGNLQDDGYSFDEYD